MTPYWKSIPKQKYLRGNAEGIIGDCWRCCIAAMIRKPAEAVPHFLEEWIKGRLKSVSADTQTWLNDNGFALVKSEYGLLYCPQWAGDDRARLPMMECGPTVRSEKSSSFENHCVVTLGGKLAYDPHPSEAGLLATLERYLIIQLQDYL